MTDSNLRKGLVYGLWKLLSAAPALEAQEAASDISRRQFACRSLRFR